MIDETSSPDENLTEDKVLQESEGGSTEPSGENEKDQLPEGAKNFQHALQMKQEALNAEKAERAKLAEEVRKYKDADKARSLENMSETDKWKALAESNSEELAKVRLERIVDDATRGKNIPQGVLDVLKETPWVFPAIKKELDLGNVSWDQTVDAVKRNIGIVVDSISQDTKTPEEPRKVDSERASDGPVITGNRPIRNRAEYDAIMNDNDPETYFKNKSRIGDYMKAHGGILPDL